MTITLPASAAGETIEKSRCGRTGKPVVIARCGLRPGGAPMWDVTVMPCESSSEREQTKKLLQASLVRPLQLTAPLRGC